MEMELVILSSENKTLFWDSSLLCNACPSSQLQVILNDARVRKCKQLAKMDSMMQLHKAIVLGPQRDYARHVAILKAPMLLQVNFLSHSCDKAHSTHWYIN